MKTVNVTFKRTEIKYRIPLDILPEFKEEFHEFLRLDEYGRTTVMSLYYDTDDHILVSRSMDKPSYKEKLRLRSYGCPNADSQVFVELKKKYKGVVYKRRSAMTLAQAENFLDRGIRPPEDTQINREIAYFIDFYRPKAAMVLSCEREAFFGTSDSHLRATLDYNIRFRSDHLRLSDGSAGTCISPDFVLLEIKSDTAMPAGLVRLLNRYGLRPNSFSKYGTAYSQSHQRPAMPRKIPVPADPAPDTVLSGSTSPARAAVSCI